MKSLILAAFLALSSGAASATTYKFTYEFLNGTDVVMGRFAGTLLGDGITISVDAPIGTLMFNGVEGTEVMVDVFFVPTGLSPFAQVGLDGSFSNFGLSNASGDTGFAVLRGGSASLFDAGSLVVDDNGTGALTIQAVPLPATLPLLVAGVGVFAAVRRRQRT